MAVRCEGWLGPGSWIKNAGRDKTDTGQDGQSGGVRRILSAWPSTISTVTFSLTENYQIQSKNRKSLEF